MANKKNLNVKNMIQAYYDSHLDAGLWEAYLVLMYAGFITEAEFNKFRETCKYWFWNFDTNSVWISTSTGEEEVRI